jgi:hypothetical protein
MAGLASDFFGVIALDDTTLSPHDNVSIDSPSEDLFIARDESFDPPFSFDDDNSLLHFLSEEMGHHEELLRDIAISSHTCSSVPTPMQTSASRIQAIAVLPNSDTASIEDIEVATKPKRKRVDRKRPSEGPNRYGRKGTLRCELCRRWRQKVYIY